MRRALLLAAAFAAASLPAEAADVARRKRAPGTSAPGAAVAIRHGPGFGAVVYATRARAYLDAGAAEGLAVDQVVRLSRGGRPAGTCEVETVASHHAICRSETARPGDTFRVSPPPAAAAPKALPRPVAPEELDRSADAVGAEPFRKVEFESKRTGIEAARPHRAEIAVAHASWASSGSGPFQQERADVTIRGAEAFAGLRAYADLRALRWMIRPETVRDRSIERTQLYVWEAELATRDPGRPFTLALGRVVPWWIPGATVFDGVQIGLPRAGRGEVGVFGGVVPELATLAPTVDRSTGGAYGSIDLGSGRVVARQDARAAVVTSPELGTRFEGQLRSLVLLGRTVNASGDLRVGVGGKRQAQGGVDGAQVDVSGRPLPRFVLSGFFRYWGLRVPDAPAPALFPGPERRGDVTTGLELGAVVVSAIGGASRDLQSGLERQYAGPQVSFPRLFGARGGVTLGYFEERGWLPGRSAYGQALVRPVPRLQLATRLSYAFARRADADGDHELGVSAGVAADLGRSFSLRASVLARVGARRYSDVERSTGLDATVGLASTF